uniref:SSD domain-containing protein n=1 Tax=Romanomermis culicivorax TaxID=13658 RepID=A0A915L200_ROMCU
MPIVKKTGIRDRKRKNRTKFRFEGHRIFPYESDCNSTENLCRESEVTNEEPRFCRVELDARLIALVLETRSNLRSWRTFQQLCSAEQLLWRRKSPIAFLNRAHLCLVYGRRKSQCCQPWHIASAAASLFNLATCSDVDRSKFDQFSTIVSYCSKYHSKILECWRIPKFVKHMRNSSNVLELSPCDDRHIPINCSTYEIYTLFAYLLPKPEFTNVTALDTNMALLVVPIYQSDVPFTPFFKDYGSRSSFLTTFQGQLKSLDSKPELELIGASLGLYNELFLDYLHKDLFYGILALFLVFICLWFNTGSILLTLFMILVVFPPLGVAYAVYVLAFTNFFPFVNLLTLILMIGLGVDDALIFLAAWNQVKSTKNAMTLEKLVTKTLKSAGSIMFVTSLTTVIALMTNLFSEILVLKYFGLFASLAVTTNYIFTMILLPPFFVIMETWSEFFEMLKFSNPQFKVLINRSESRELFHNHHPFERWNDHLRYNFDGFSKDALAGGNFSMSMHIVFGIEPKLAKSGDILLRTWSNESYNLGSNGALLFFIDFCNNMRFSVNFTAKLDFPTLLPYCFVPDFFEWMKKPCKNLIGEDQRPCCEYFSFPYYPGVFDQCLKRFLDRYPRHVKVALARQPYRTGPLLDNNSNFRALTIFFPSIYNFSTDFTAMHYFYWETSRFIEKLLADGPVDVRKGWFVSDWLDYYDLQRALVVGVKYSVIFAVCIAVLIVFLTIGNVVIGLLCALCICSVIVLTIASMLLLDWHLNILESTIIVLAIGISFDYTLHFATVARHLILEINILQSDEHSGSLLARRLISKASSSVSGAALTTALVGFAMLPALMSNITKTEDLFQCTLLYWKGTSTDRYFIYLHLANLKHYVNVLFEMPILVVLLDQTVSISIESLPT